MYIKYENCPTTITDNIQFPNLVDVASSYLAHYSAESNGPTILRHAHVLPPRVRQYRIQIQYIINNNTVLYIIHEIVCIILIIHK